MLQYGNFCYTALGQNLRFCATRNLKFCPRTVLFGRNMRVIESLEEFTQPRNPLVLTIGNFDGMHRGHCAVLRKVKAVAGSEGQSVVITFRNHPSEVLRPDHPVCFLCSLPHRLRLLEELGIDDLILLTFTKRLAQHNAAFL